MNTGTFLLVVLAAATILNLVVMSFESGRVPYEPGTVQDPGLAGRINRADTRLESGQLYENEFLELHRDQDLRDINWHVSSSLDEQEIKDMKDISKAVIRKARVYNQDGNGRVDIYLYDDFDQLFQKMVSNGMDQNLASELIRNLKRLGGVYLYYENLILINPLNLNNHDLFLHVLGHELAHHYQSRYCSRPVWFSEGFAELISFNAMAEKNNQYASDYFNRVIENDHDRTRLRGMEDSEILDRSGYETSFLAVNYLLSNFNGNYYSGCGYNTSTNWKEHFSSTFGLTPEEFYGMFEKAEFERIG